MNAFVVEQYGPNGLFAAQVPDPIVGPRDVLVRVSAASINPLEELAGELWRWTGGIESRP
jgi:NADPH:quinone reductase-like Zn-dependent oxidoreductase